jgi:hypothetical protein
MRKILAITTLAFGLAACSEMSTQVPSPSAGVTAEARQSGVSDSAACGEASCVPVTAAYISHFTGAGCTGTESYYTAYYGYDGVRRSWDGGGVVGTTLRTVTNKSWKDSSGLCHDSWPSGNTLSDFVTVYRSTSGGTGGGSADSSIVCGEASCVPVTGAYISHFTGAGCVGTESYYTAYNGYDGIRRSWDGHGIVGTTLRTVTNKSWKDASGACHDDWPSGNTLSDFVTVYRAGHSVCGEASCVPVTGAYISHFTNGDCTGTESYYTAYNGYDGVRRSWDGHGVVGTTLRTVTNRSWKMNDGGGDGTGCRQNAWPAGNTLSDFVTVYR